MDMLFHVRGSAVTATVVGTMTEALVAPAAEGAFVGVRFRPGEAYAFLGGRAASLANDTITLEDFGLAGADELVDRVARSPAAGRFTVLDRWLSCRLGLTKPADPRVRAAVALVERSGGRTRAAQVAAAVGLSERQLERLFGERVGVGPKVLARIVRIQGVVAALDEAVRTSEAIAWAALAAREGYADQAHLVREVKALTGVSPSTLARERTFATAVVTAPLPR